MRIKSNSIKNVCFLKYETTLELLHKIIKLTGKITRKTWARLSKSRQIVYKEQKRLLIMVDFRG